MLTRPPGSMQPDAAEVLIAQSATFAPLILLMMDAAQTREHASKDQRLHLSQCVLTQVVAQLSRLFLIKQKWLLSPGRMAGLM